MTTVGEFGGKTRNEGISASVGLEDQETRGEITVDKVAGLLTGK